VLNYIGSQLNPKKVTTIINFLTPKTMANVRAFMGPTGYYEMFIASYAKITKPLFALTKKDCKFVWMPIC
jgi:hypothetical protein